MSAASLVPQRDLVPFFVPSTSDGSPHDPPVLNAALTAFSTPPRPRNASSSSSSSSSLSTAAASPADLAPPRVWDKETGFFVDAATGLPAPSPALSSPVSATRGTPSSASHSHSHSHPSPAATPAQRRGKKNPRASPSPARPGPKRFAGSTFESASPAPDALPMPSFANTCRIEPRVLAPRRDANFPQSDAQAATGALKQLLNVK